MLEPARLKRVSDALRAASKVFDTTGEVFFRSLTEHLNDVLHVDFVSIGELSDDGRRIRTVAVSAEGRNLENLEYELDHTPCQQALENGRYFDHRDVQARFPLDEFLVQMGFQSYLGVALADSTGHRLGVMSVMSRHPLADPQTAELTLGLFAARTSVEMERRRSERALQASEARNRAILQAIPDVMFVLDRAGRVLDYAATDANELYAPPEQVIGRHIRDRLPEDAAEDVARAAEQTINSAQPSSVTFSVESAKGTFFYDALVVPFDANSSLMIARDITSHRQATLDLENSNRFFQKLAKTMPGVLFVYDLIEKRILYVNPGAWEALGYSDDDYRKMGDAFLDMTIHPEDQPKLKALAQEYPKAADGDVFTHLFRMRHKSGEWRWVHRKFTVFSWTPDGRPQQLVGTAIDVTETRTAEEEMRKLPGLLLHAQDQERRRIARELHDTTAQNMTAISLNLARLERDGLPPAAAQILADCQTLCGASLREIRTLSYLLHPPMLDEVGLESAVRWFVGGLESRSGLRVTVDAPPGMERLPAALERDLFFVVQEALMNVVRHSGSETADVHLERQAAQVILKIRDNGRGMLGAKRQPPNDWAFVGVGIPSMRERLRQNSGGLEILSNDQGTTIIATVSLQEERTDPPLLGIAPAAGVT